MKQSLGGRVVKVVNLNLLSYFTVGYQYTVCFCQRKNDNACDMVCQLPTHGWLFYLVCRLSLSIKLAAKRSIEMLLKVAFNFWQTYKTAIDIVYTRLENIIILSGSMTERFLVNSAINCLSHLW